MFGKQKYPVLKDPAGEIVLRCSICNGEQVICVKSKGSNDLREIMLVNSDDDLEGFCKANGLDPASIRKVY